MRTGQLGSATFCVLVVGSLVVGPVMESATADSGRAAPQLRSAVEDTKPLVENQPNVTMSNFEMVKGLDSAGKCLYNNSVFPAGGTGFTNSALPYDGLSDLDRSVATFRAELLRTYGADVASVEPVVDKKNTVTGLIVNVTPSSVVASTPLDELALTVSDAFEESLIALADLSVQINIAPHAVQGLISSCPIQELIATGELWRSAGLPPDSPAETSTNGETGQLELSVGKKAIAKVRAVLAPYGDQVVVTELVGEVEFQGRGNTYTPRYGGSSIYSVAFNESCTDGFRIGGNSLSTAGHCPNTNWVSPYS